MLHKPSHTGQSRDLHPQVLFFTIESSSHVLQQTSKLTLVRENLYKAPNTSPKPLLKLCNSV
jgi:hypothetical protein